MQVPVKSRATSRSGYGPELPEGIGEIVTHRGLARRGVQIKAERGRARTPGAPSIGGATQAARVGPCLAPADATHLVGPSRPDLDAWGPRPWVPRGGKARHEFACAHRTSDPPTGPGSIEGAGKGLYPLLRSYGFLPGAAQSVLVRASLRSPRPQAPGTLRSSWEKSHAGIMESRARPRVSVPPLELRGRDGKVMAWGWGVPTSSARSGSRSLRGMAAPRAAA